MFVFITMSKFFKISFTKGPLLTITEKFEYLRNQNETTGWRRNSHNPNNQNQSPQNTLSMQMLISIDFDCLFFYSKQSELTTKLLANVKNDN